MRRVGRISLWRRHGHIVARHMGTALPASVLSSIIYSESESEFHPSDIA
jgi:hypothetical protein